jgi:RNA recognition motif-containing protein
MNAKIYVENFAADITESELTELFSAYGNVADVNIAFDSDGKSRGFGRVTMVTSEGARAAIQALNGKTVGAATLAVAEWWSSPDVHSPERTTKKAA